MTAQLNWRRLSCKVSALRLDIVLPAGQSFRWRETNPGEWSNVLADRVFTLKQDGDNILYRVFEPTDHEVHGFSKKTTVRKSADCESVGKYDSVLRDYFQLDVDVKSLHERWSKADVNFAQVAESFSGVRTLRQDPVETLFAFICSTNNNIPRISSMVEKLCQKYGAALFEVDGVMYFSFPTIKALAGTGVEHQLRDLGFGYRAKFVNQSARYILENYSEEWLHNLRDVSYTEAHEALCKLPGVGAKVADCVCLLSLDKSEAIPVDTHVWQITSKCYMPSLTKTKSLTDKVYKQIGDHYRMLFGKYAGWAQSVLFTADLKKFQDVKALDTSICTKKRKLDKGKDCKEEILGSADKKQLRDIRGKCS